MKTRCGFVSNSSSSSFVVIGNNTQMLEPLKKTYKDKPVKLIPCDFGWETVQYRYFEEKLSWAVLQLDEAWDFIGKLPEQIKREKQYNGEWYSETKWHSKKDINSFKDMLDKVLKENLECSSFAWKYELSEDYGYIDHQSCYGEIGPGALNIIFKDEETLKNFLFGSDSYIQGGNDNGD